MYMNLAAVMGNSLCTVLLLLFYTEILLQQYSTILGERASLCRIHTPSVEYLDMLLQWECGF